MIFVVKMDIINQLKKDVDRAAFFAKSQAEFQAGCQGLSEVEIQKTFIRYFKSQLEVTLLNTKKKIKKHNENLASQKQTKQSLAKQKKYQTFNDATDLENESPIFDKYGNFLAVDSEGYSSVSRNFI